MIEKRKMNASIMRICIIKCGNQSSANGSPSSGSTANDICESLCKISGDGGLVRTSSMSLSESKAMGNFLAFRANEFESVIGGIRKFNRKLFTPHAVGSLWQWGRLLENVLDLRKVFTR